MDSFPFTFPDDITLEEYEFYRPARPLPQYMPPGENLNLSEPSYENQNAAV